MNEIVKGTLMTTKEVAEQLGCTTKTVRENAKKCLSNKVFQHGKQTFWDKTEITILIEQMKTSNPNQSTCTAAVQGITTNLTPALMIKQAFELAQKGYELEIANLKARNIEVIEENGQLRLKNKQLNHALEYDKIKDWHRWRNIKKEVKYKGKFETLAYELKFVEGEDFERKVMGNDKYPTIMISPEATEMIFEELR